MKTNIKKFLSIALVCVMVLGMFSSVSFADASSDDVSSGDAAGSQSAGETTTDISGGDASGNDFNPGLTTDDLTGDVSGNDGIMTLADMIDGTSGDTEFHKMTSTDELQEGYHYIIVYGTPVDGSYPALTPDEANYYIGITMTEAMRTSGSGLKVDSNASCVLTLSVSSSNAWNFTASNVTGTGNRLRLNSGVLFDTQYGGIAITEDSPTDGTWILQNNRPLRWNGSGFEASTRGTDPATPVEIWTDYEVKAPTRYIQLTSIDQLNDLGPATPFVVVVAGKDGNRYAINNTNPNNWPVVTQVEDPAGNYIELTDDFSYVFTSHGDSSLGSRTVTIENSDGSTEASIEKYIKFEFIQLASGYQFYLNAPGEGVSSVDISSSPFRSSGSNRNNQVTFQTGTGSESQFYLRGNGDNRWLSYSSNIDSGYDYASGVIDGDRVKVEVYADLLTPGVNGDTLVEFMDADGNLYISYYVDGKITPIRGLPNIEKDGYEYFFIGWSTVRNDFLTLEESANLYTYIRTETETDDEGNVISTKDISGFNTVKTEDELGLNLLGDGNPESPSPIELTAIPGYNGEATITLYPVYAVLGKDTVVTAMSDGKIVIGVSDWKADQDESHRYQDPARERWLGSIDIEIYLDGEIWVPSTPMYFSYHNDNSADLNIKFVWNDLVEEKLPDSYLPEEYQGMALKDVPYEVKLYAFMSHYNKDNNFDFPLYDQAGHFVIDGVFATQGGSDPGTDGKNGIYYTLNWLTDHGGQLDNVRGGTTVKIYVTTKYNIKYYLDDKLIEDAAWTTEVGKPYTTLGTEKALEKIWAEAVAGGEMAFRVKEDNDLHALMDGSITDKTQSYVPEEGIDRDGYADFLYCIHNYDHTLPIAGSPESLVSADRVLTSTSWVLKNQTGEAKETVAWSAQYPITGTYYSTGNTAYTFKDNLNLNAFAADDPYIYHLYAYTAPKPTDPPAAPVINNPLTDDTNNLTLWIVLMVVSILGMCAMLLFYKADQKDKNRK